jgi:hypothetical protein
MGWEIKIRNPRRLLVIHYDSAICCRHCGAGVSPNYRKQQGSGLVPAHHPGMTLQGIS